jgi:hypothetical protein
MKPSIRAAALSYLSGDDYTRVELEHLIGCSHGGLHKAIHKLHAEKEIHVCKWNRPDGRGKFEAIWRAGNKPDARPPKPYTHTERARLHYQRNAKRINAKRAAKLGRPINPFAQLMWAAR